MYFKVTRVEGVHPAIPEFVRRIEGTLDPLLQVWKAIHSAAACVVNDSPECSLRLLRENLGTYQFAMI